MRRDDTHRIKQELASIAKLILTVKQLLDDAPLQQQSLVYPHLRDLAEQIQEMVKLVERLKRAPHIALMADVMSRQN